MSFPGSLHIFCRVVDNFGDIGVCWRLARQLAGEYQIQVTLWVDDLVSFRKICSTIDIDAPNQQVQDVLVRHWIADFKPLPADQVADVVIEAFACELPAAYIAAMAERRPKPVWINLEYLSAESWVDTCHAMPSHYPSLPLIKHFFFPGFSDRTGGLFMERDLPQMRAAFLADPRASAEFLAKLGVQRVAGECMISLFCYPNAPVAQLFESLQADTRASLCLVPQGVASEAIGTFLQQPAIAGTTTQRGNLRVQVIPFMDQPDYDKLLWSCDLNFVRGEDSLVRAQWAQRPFVWHIYPQQEDAHHLKLEAFLDRYLAGADDALAQSVRGLWRSWNTGVEAALPWKPFQAALPALHDHQLAWTRQLLCHGDLASNLMRFIRNIG
jgi:uncharacterized repeat protein (TIGR03837 family)